MMASDFEVTELPNGKFRCKMRVASAFFAAVIGKKGASKRRIEIETKTRVDIPRQVIKLLNHVFIVKYCTQFFSKLEYFLAA